MNEQQNTSKTQKTQDTGSRVSYWERKLLDLTKANTLINIRPSSGILPFTNMATAELYDALTSNEKYVLQSIGNTSDAGLCTELDSKELDKRAKSILRASNSNAEEIGNAQLFVALGMLNYWDNPNPMFSSQKPEQHKAPLILVPVQMTKQRVTGAYYIVSTGDDALVNITLIELLKQQHERNLSSLIPTDDKPLNYKEVMQTFKLLAASKQDWSFTEETCLGIFSFSKFVMWDDIHTHSEEMRSSSLVESLVQKRKTESMAQPEASAREMDVTAKPIEVILPVDADSSQMEAVVDAESGKSFLLYGPPGTGKSQTITNIIANAIYHDQQVLFVAQKRAALEVVQERLQNIGIGAFCIELHSNKANKSHLITQLQAAIESVPLGDEKQQFVAASDQLFLKRKELLQTIERLYAKHSAHGDSYSLADCIEQCITIGEPTLRVSLRKDSLQRTTNAEMDSIVQSLREMETVRSTYGDVQKHPLRHLLPRSAKPEELERLRSHLQVLRQDVVEVSLNSTGLRKLFVLGRKRKQYHLHEIQLTDYAGHDLTDIVDYEAKQTQITAWLSHTDMLDEWSHYGVRWNRLTDMGYPQLADSMDTADAGQLSQAVRYAVWRQRALDIIANDETLKLFNGKIFEEAVAEYRRLCAEFQSLTKRCLLQRLQENVQRTLNSQNPVTQASLTVIRRWIKQHGRGMSIRRLFEDHGETIRSLCPCMLTSPISVAQYLPIHSSRFDIVIFDEASQIPTSEAVGAIARGKATIIVGDPKQMPPTTFFQTQLSADEDLQDADMESILDDCITLGMPYRYLNYHYRSRHESLIAFSNHYFYGDHLLTFPSADNHRSHLHYCYTEGVYDYSATRTNRKEAEAVVDEVVRRLESDELSQMSMGVIAFSKVQQDLILDLLQDRLAHRHELERRAFGDVPEPLFVKNLENVQGDERDVIIFSVGYGWDKDQKISMNFGPLNNDGGERRLNVAVTRARSEMYVFTNMHSDDIDLSKTQAVGVEGLKNFLHYAECGELLIGAGVERPAVKAHPIAEELATALRHEGYKVDTNVGQSDFRVDVAVLDPTQKDTYMLGILLDGGQYYATPTVHDREVIQPEVLHRLGWRLLRVRQEDYFRYPESVVRGVMGELKIGQLDN